MLELVFLFPHPVSLLWFLFPLSVLGESLLFLSILTATPNLHFTGKLGSNYRSRGDSSYYYPNDLLAMSDFFLLFTALGICSFLRTGFLYYSIIVPFVWQYTFSHQRSDL